MNPLIVTETAKRMSTGWLVRDSDPLAERLYPVEQWAADQRANGIRVAHRRIIVVEDWTEDLPPDGPYSTPAEPQGCAHGWPGDHD